MVIVKLHNIRALTSAFSTLVLEARLPILLTGLDVAKHPLSHTLILASNLNIPKYTQLHKSTSIVTILRTSIWMWHIHLIINIPCQSARKIPVNRIAKSDPACTSRPRVRNMLRNTPVLTKPLRVSEHGLCLKMWKLCIYQMKCLLEFSEPLARERDANARHSLPCCLNVDF